MRKNGFLFRLALLNTFKRKIRAGLAIGGIALSSAVMILLFGVSDGLKSLVTEQVSNADATSVITVNQRNVQQVVLDQQRVSSIRSISGVADVQQLVGLVGEIRYHGSTVNLPLYGVTNDFFRASPIQKVTGTIDRQPQGMNIILSTKALETFGVKPGEAQGKALFVKTTIPEAYAEAGRTEAERKVKEEAFTVVGSIDRGNLPVAYIPHEYLAQKGLTSVSQLKVTATFPEKIPSIRESIEQMGYQTTSIQDSIDQVNRIFEVIQRIILLFGVIALAITIVGTFNVITLTLIEEMKQIAFLRLMGMQKASVGFLFTTQAIMLTMAGALIGTMLGVLLGIIVNGAAQSLVGDTAFTGDVYIFQIPTVQIIIILMLSVLLGWLIGLTPAKRAVAVGPLEELRA